MQPNDVLTLIRKLPDLEKEVMVDEAGLYVSGSLNDTVTVAYQCGDISEDLIIAATVRQIRKAA